MQSDVAWNVTDLSASNILDLDCIPVTRLTTVELLDIHGTDLTDRIYYVVLSQV
jgi:hypothetical protein